MRVKKIGQGGEYTDFSLQDGVVTVGTIDVDLADRQSDSQQIITITRTGDEFFLEKGGRDYAAVIEIPPKKYIEEIVSEDETLITPIELDIHAVVITLWPVRSSENIQEEE